MDSVLRFLDRYLRYISGTDKSTGCSVLCRIFKPFITRSTCVIITDCGFKDNQTTRPLTMLGTFVDTSIHQILTRSTSAWCCCRCSRRPVCPRREARRGGRRRPGGSRAARSARGSGSGGRGAATATSASRSARRRRIAKPPTSTNVKSIKDRLVRYTSYLDNCHAIVI